MSYASYQVGAPEGAQTDTSNLVPENTRPVNLRAGSNGISLNGDRVQEHGHNRLNTADLPNGETGALATVRTPWGSPRGGSEIQPTDIISVGGQEMQVKIAERLGLIEKGAHGRYVEVSGSVEKLTNPEAEKVPEALDESGLEALPDSKAEAGLASLCDVVSPGTQISVLSQFVETGEVMENTLNRAASEAGLHPGELSARFQQVVAGFEAQADQSIKAMGSDDTSEFWAWAQENHAKELKAAMRSQAMDRTTKGYAPLYQAYVASIGDSDPESVLSAEFGGGITASKVDGKVLLQIPGIGQVPFNVAVRQGFVRVRGA